MRGALLLAVAIGIGVILLNAAPNENGSRATAVRTARSSGTTSPSTTPATTRAPVATPTSIGLRQPAQVTVLVANGTKVPGAAGKVKQQLAVAGYTALAPTDTTSTDSQTTTVQYTPGFQAEAGAMAQALNLPASAVAPLASPLPLPSINGANILVVLGTDFAAQLAGQGSSEGPASTVSPPPTSLASQPTTTTTLPAHSTTTTHTSTTRH